MKASYLWIRDYLPDYRSPPETMAEQLTFSGTEIEKIERIGEDSVFDAGVTSNRVDCLGHLGLAREVAAVSGVAVVAPPCTAQETGPETGSALTLRVAESELCPRYVARVIDGVRVMASPAWLKQRIEAIGLRSINNVVDLTNFVMFELNQPLHAFDLATLKGAAIIVRRARAGETLMALNGQMLALVADDLVIADAERAVALAGVMGGLETEVAERTTSILIESACFQPAAVRRSARRLFLRTDASFRFERGVDRNGASQAANRCARLMLEVCGGILRKGALDQGGAAEASSPIVLRLSRVTEIAGISIERRRISTILRALACEVVEEESLLRVTRPSFRADLSREIDLVEEVVRVHGLELIPEDAAMPVRTVVPHRGRELRERLKDRMVGLGFLETVTPDFVHAAAWGGVCFLPAGETVHVKNPVRSGEGALRRSLLPSLLQVRKLNQDVGNADLAFFEITNLQSSIDSLGMPEGLPALGFLMDGDWRAARGVVESLLENAGIAASFVPTAAAGLDPGARAEILSGGRRLGYLGVPARGLLKEAGLKARPLYGEIDLRPLQEGRVAAKFKPLPRFPGIERDLALLVREELTFGALESEIRELALANLESLDLFEIYRDKARLGEGRKSLNIRLIFRAPDRTLLSEEVDRGVNAVIERLAASVGAEVRKG